MAFPEDYLHPNEELILDLKPHWFRMLPTGGALAAAVIVGVFIFTKTNVQALNILAGLAILATLAWFIQAYVAWTSTHFVLTSDRLIHRRGVVSRSGIEIPLERINTVFSHQSIFERLIGAGDLVIESASAEGRQEFDDMRHPDTIQNEIYVAMEANRNRTFNQSVAAATAAARPVSEPVDPQASVPEQIEQLHSLKERGLITDAEFEAKKAELLGRM
ncbi:MAG: PH domain-containing protein [Acidimicrobiia bacterium]